MLISYKGRSREGAWIEIHSILLVYLLLLGRSREGAWIEIALPMLRALILGGRSREGAWIEISKQVADAQVILVAHARERGLKSQTSGTTDVSHQGRSREGAWIEIRI